MKQQLEVVDLTHIEAITDPGEPCLHSSREYALLSDRLHSIVSNRGGSFVSKVVACTFLRGGRVLR